METYAEFKAFAEVYFCIYYIKLLSVFCFILLTKEITEFEPGWDFSGAEVFFFVPQDIDVYLVFIKYT